MVLVGDYANGTIYKLDKQNYTDSGQYIRRLRRAPHLVTDLQRQYFDELQIQFQPGVGTTGFSVVMPTTYINDPYYIAPTATLTIGPTDVFILGKGSKINTVDTTTYPQAMLRWSNDGGSTWSNEHWVTIGKTGKYKNRAIWRRLGVVTADAPRQKPCQNDQKGQNRYCPPVIEVVFHFRAYGMLWTGKP